MSQSASGIVHPLAAPLAALLQNHLSEDKALALLAQLNPDRLHSDELSVLVPYLLGLILEQAPVVPELCRDTLDCCGTGGSGLSHFNISTASAFVLAAAGLQVVKFGNRGITRTSGSFDFLSALGISHEVPLSATPELVEKTGLAFVFAPQCYPSLKPISQLRQRLGEKTLFNYLGPLLNPFFPAYRLMGNSQPRLSRILGDCLQQQPGLKAGWVVSGRLPSGPVLDEMTLGGQTAILEVTPEAQGEKLWRSPFLSDLPGAETVLSAQDNVRLWQAMCAGEDTRSVWYHTVCLNAAAGLMVQGITDDLQAAQAEVSELFSTGAVQAQVVRTQEAYRSWPQGQKAEA